MRHLHHCWPPPSSRRDEGGSRSAPRSTPASPAWPTWRNGTRRRRGGGARSLSLMSSTVLSRRDNNIGNLPIASIPMEEVSSIVNGYRRGSGATSGPGRRNGSRTTGRGGAADPSPSPLGKLASIVFLDDDALYWTKRRRCGAVSNSEAATTLRGGGDADGQRQRLPRRRQRLQGAGQDDGVDDVYGRTRPVPETAVRAHAFPVAPQQ